MFSWLRIVAQLYGLEKFWAFMKYYKKASSLQVDPELQQYLDKYKTIEDFRVLAPQLDEMVKELNLTPNKGRPRSVSESEGGNVVIGGRETASSNVRYAAGGEFIRPNKDRAIPRYVLLIPTINISMKQCRVP